MKSCTPRLGLSAWCAVCFAACSPASAPRSSGGSPTIAAAPNPQESPLVPPGPSGYPEPSSDLASRQIQRTLARVSGMRRLPARGPVAGRVIDRPTMLRQVKEQVRAQVPSEAIRGENAFLTAFGFIPKDFDYEAGVYRLIEDQLAGYYDPDRKTMFLIADLSRLEAEVTLAHELAHALQDQHYDLGPQLEYKKNAGDGQAALHCLAEGDATSLMLDFTLESAGVTAISISDRRLRLEIAASMAMSPELASFPRILRDSLLAPYIDGVLFVHALRRRGGWKMVDYVWANPPGTTEQVLHLDKLDAREPAEPIADPVSPSHGNWETVHTDVYGEQGFRIALEEWMPRRAAADAAAGWAGDRAAVIRQAQRDSNVAVAAWHVRFDRGGRLADSEAIDAIDALASSWGLTHLKGSHLCHTLKNGRRVAVARTGRDIALVVGADPALVGSTHTPSACSFLGGWALAISAQK